MQDVPLLKEVEHLIFLSKVKINMYLGIGLSN